jgi:tetratricopeptide (TPR) repeat protein
MQRNYFAFELLASLLMARHEFVAARDVALRADSLDPGNSSHLALLGEIELELGDYQSAGKHFAAIQYDGRNFTTGARLARWYELTGHIDVAREYLKRAIVKVDRRDDLPREQAAWFHYRLGDLELRVGNVAAAESAFVSGLARNPDDVRILGGLARAALARGAWQEAVDYGERATEYQLDPATLGTVSLAYAKLGDSAQAKAYAHAMSVSALKQPGAIHRAWGLFLLDHGTRKDRADVLRRARKELRDRKDVYGHDLMAWALYHNGYVQNARDEMKLALSQHTQDVMLLEHARVIGVTPARLSASAQR